MGYALAERGLSAPDFTRARPLCLFPFTGARSRDVSTSLIHPDEANHAEQRY